MIGWQLQTNASLRAEIAALPAAEPAVAALRAENEKLGAALREVEQLRSDDVELKRLEQSVTELRATSAARARAVAAAAPPAPRAATKSEQMAEKMLADERMAELEIVRMNQELAVATARHEQLVRRAQVMRLTAEQRMSEEQAAQKRLAEIEMKRREIQTFADNVRTALTRRVEVAREVLAREGEFLSLPAGFPSVGGRTAAARARQTPSP